MLPPSKEGKNKQTKKGKQLCLRQMLLQSLSLFLTLVISPSLLTLFFSKSQTTAFFYNILSTHSSIIFLIILVKICDSKDDYIWSHVPYETFFFFFFLSLFFLFFFRNLHYGFFSPLVNEYSLQINITILNLDTISDLESKCYITPIFKHFSVCLFVLLLLIFIRRLR